MINFAYTYLSYDSQNTSAFLSGIETSFLIF
jgi:hypothetical protein